MKKLLIMAPLFLSLVPSAPLVAQTEHQTAFTGVWKLDVAKSTYPPGTAPRRLTLKFADDGRTIVSGVNAEGKTFQWSFPWSGGQEVVVEGIDHATATQTFQGNLCDAVMKDAGRVSMTVHAVRSANGKTQTGTITYIDKQGIKAQHTEFYEKQ